MRDDIPEADRQEQDRPIAATTDDPPPSSDDDRLVDLSEEWERR